MRDEERVLARAEPKMRSPAIFPAAWKKLRCRNPYPKSARVSKRKSLRAWTSRKVLGLRMRIEKRYSAKEGGAKDTRA